MKRKQSKQEIDPAKWHQLNVARKTLRMNDAFVRFMGGMTKDEARQLLLANKHDFDQDKS